MGTLLVVVAVFLIGFAADIGHHYGDTLVKGKPRVRAITVFIVGFWVLDVSNNMLQGPCRALLGDISGDSQRLTRISNSAFSFFMGAGNIVGYLTGAQEGLHRIFRFTQTTACDVYCANLKSCFFISAAILIVLTVIALVYVREKPWSPESEQGRKLESGELAAEKNEQVGGLMSFVGALKSLDRPIEVYGGNDSDKLTLYEKGIQAGSWGLMINSIVLLVCSFAIEPLAKKLGVKFLWGGVNLILGICLAMTVLITKQAKADRRHGAVMPSSAVMRGAMAVFGILGLPLAVTYSIPFAMASIYSHGSGAGQGLSLGVLNLAICLPQMVISFASGPFDAALGGGNLPAFVVGAVVAIISAICAATLLRKPTAVS
ncbi:Sucrose transport protein SUC5 [Linum grandiflorum]